MSDFADVSSTNESTFNKPRFLKLIPGFPVIVRILDKKAYKVYKHFIPKQKASVMCLGWEHCPICQKNKELADANPNVPYGEVKGIIPRQTRFMVNVLNRTVAKITSEGNVIYAGFDGSFPNQDPESGEILTNIEAEPLNRVEILERGKTLFADLNNRSKMVMSADKGINGIWDCDVMLVASGKGRDMTISVETRPQDNDVVNVPPEDLFVLETVPLQLTPDEMRLVVRGVSISDIFAERKAQKETEVETTNDSIPEGMLDEIEREIDDIFADDD